MVTELRDTDVVKRTLAAGQMHVTDPDTGYHRSMYAECPTDRRLAPIHRIVREHGDEITEVVVRCPWCGTEFSASVDAIVLK